MKLSRWLSWILLAGALARAASGPVSAADFFNFLHERDTDVITVTDVTDEGKKWPQPAPGKPVYYEAMSFGSNRFPGLPGDVTPNSRAMLKMIVDALKKQGYVEATEKGQASVFISISWGYSRRNAGALGFLGGDKLGLADEFSSLGYLTINKVRQHARSGVEQMVMEAVNDNLYIASIRAYDLKALDAGTEKILWHTRIACPATGLTMNMALPTMIKLATPMIGVETKKPVWRTPAGFMSEHIEIGPARSVEFMDSAKPTDRNEPTERSSKD